MFLRRAFSVAGLHGIACIFGGGVGIHVPLAFIDPLLRGAARTSSVDHVDGRLGHEHYRLGAAGDGGVIGDLGIDYDLLAGLAVASSTETASRNQA